MRTSFEKLLNDGWQYSDRAIIACMELAFYAGWRAKEELDEKPYYWGRDVSEIKDI